MADEDFTVIYDPSEDLPEGAEVIYEPQGALSGGLTAGRPAYARGALEPQEGQYATIGQEFGRGVDISQAMLGGGVGGLGGLVGSDWLKEKGLEIAERNLTEAQQYPPSRISRVEDIQTPADFIDWAKYAAGQAIPSMAAPLAGSAIGAAAGFATPIPGGAAAGGVVGAFLPSYLMNSGDAYLELLEKGYDRPDAAAAAGLPMALLDSITPVKIAGRLFWKPVTEATKRGLGRRIAAESVKGAGREGVTEAAQEAWKKQVVSRVADEEFLTSENLSEIINEGAVGAIAGAGFGAAAGVVPDRGNAPLQREHERQSALDALAGEAEPDPFEGLQPEITPEEAPPPAAPALLPPPEAAAPQAEPQPITDPARLLEPPPTITEPPSRRFRASEPGGTIRPTPAPEPEPEVPEFLRSIRARLDQIRAENRAKGLVDERIDESAREYFADRWGTAQKPAEIVEQGDVDAAVEVQPPAEPTPAQAEAGNYQQTHVKWHGLDIAIETRRGGTRRDTANDPPRWEVSDFPAHYGRIKRVEGADGDEVDVYLGNTRPSDTDTVWVVDQIDPETSDFDEHKVMAGFASRDEAVTAYMRAFSDGSGADRWGAETEMTIPEFKDWLDNGDTANPVAYIEPSMLAQTTPAEEPEPADPEIAPEPPAAPAEVPQISPVPSAEEVASAPERPQELEGGAEIAETDVEATSPPQFQKMLNDDGRAVWQGTEYRVEDFANAGWALKIRRAGEPVTTTLGGTSIDPWSRDRAISRAMQDAFPAYEPTRPLEEFPPPEPAPAPEPEEPETGSMDDLSEHFAEAFVSNIGFETITAARKRAGDFLGRKIKPGTKDAKAVDEAIELGVVLAARRLIELGRLIEKSDAQIYRDIVDLYNRQPSLTTRTSGSMLRQAYSTPVPLSFIASRLAGLRSDSTVYEPTAGNGSMLIEATPGNAYSNELDEARADNLSSQGFNVTQQDAMTATPPKVDVVLMNPPFGVVKDDNDNAIMFRPEGVLPFVTTQIDHAVAIDSLNKAMRPDSTAVLVVAGPAKTAKSDKARSDAYNGKRKREFYFTLYNGYNVVDHFSVSGDLYTRQGAGWPVDVIVIQGRGKSERPLPAVEVPRIYDSLAEMEELVSGTTPTADTVSPAERPGAVPAGPGPGSSPGPGGDTGPGDVLLPSGGQGEGADVPGGRPAGSDEPAVEGVLEGDPGRVRDVAGQGDAGPAGERPGGVEPGPVGALQSEGLQSDIPAERPAEAEPAEPAAADDAARLDRPRPRRPEVEETERQTAYTPASGAEPMATLVPANLKDSITDSLAKLQTSRKDVDAFVAEELGVKDPAKLFGAEQIDAIALAIENLKRGAGFILGDQTGVGKGRVVAAMIRYAIKNGKTPIFVTEKVNLYKDMWRDLTDTGMGDIKPISTNSGPKVPLDDAETVFLKGGQKNNELLDLANKGDLGDYDVVFTTYSQMEQSERGVGAHRRNFLRTFARGGILIFDESHNAGGSGLPPDPKKTVQPRSEFARELIRIADGAIYSSATYAKRPDSMTLYYKTDMRHAVKSIDELPDTISKGGVPLQQATAAMLAQAGQYIRRERSYAGVEYKTVPAPVDQAKAEQMSSIMRAILNFDKAKRGAVEAIDDNVKTEAGNVQHDGATGDAGASTTNFTSIMHNLIDQMLLGLKVDAAVQQVIDTLKADEKPVVTVANTMGSFISEYAKTMEMKPGEVIDLDFRSLFQRYLERSREVRISRPFQNTEIYYLTDEELGPVGLGFYNNAKKMIEDSDIADVPVSPIDHMIWRLESEGYSVGEITGRTATINYAGKEGPTYRIRPQSELKPSGRNRTLLGFNSGKLDVMILNQAGATGLSIHASEKFKDKRRRHMIIAQAEKNIDTHMQMLGRVHRTGQVVTPRYSQLIADIPAETRPAAVLAKKMASLNANTTAARGGAMTAENVPDIINAYGDQVVADIMLANPEMFQAMDEPLSPAQRGAGYEVADAARKVTGRIPLLPIADQRRLYDLIETDYAELIERMNAMGENSLEAKTLPLDARTLDSQVVVDGNPSLDSPFTEAVNMERVDVKRLGKPYTSAQVREMAEPNFGVTKTLARDLTASFGIYLDEALSGFSNEKKAEAAATRLRAQYEHVTNLLGRFRVSATVLLRTNEGNFYGAVTKVEHKEGAAKNPAAPSTWRFTFAVADAMRSLTLPASQIITPEMGDLEGAVVVEGARTGPAGESILEMFDKQQTESREERTMLTGNILAAFNLFNRGQIVNYVTSDGRTQQGVLLPRAMDAETELQDQPVVFRTPEVAMAFLDQAGSVTTRDRALTISKRGADYIFETSASRQTGGQYFLNRRILDAAGDEFVRVGNVMRLQVPDRATALNIARIVQERSPFAAFENKDVATQLQSETDRQYSATPAAGARTAPFFSVLTEGVRGLKQAKAPGKQWAGMIKNLPGVKQEEVDWSGVLDWLDAQEGTVTKDELLAYLDANEVRVQEVTRGGGPPLGNLWVELERLGTVPAHPKYAQYTLPGGENYRELLLTLPTDIVEPPADIQSLSGAEDFIQEITGEVPDLVDDDAVLEMAERLWRQRFRQESNLFTGGHFDEPNVLAHVRFNERTDADGKRVLFIEEIQSDWHQKGRKQGYEAGAISAQDRQWFEDYAHDIDRTPRQFATLVLDDVVDRDDLSMSDAEFERARLIASNMGGGIPDAPFKKTWHELAFRRMVRWAAENGFEKVAWTTGEQQAERYDLSKHISMIGYQRRGDMFNIKVWDKNEAEILNQQSADTTWLENHLGKEMAQKIIDGEGRQEGEFKYLEDLDLKVGGEGMRAFYDKMLPAYAKKFGKKFGARVGRADVVTAVEPGGAFNVSGRVVGETKPTEYTTSVHALDITPKMREAALEGLPLFALTRKAQANLPDLKRDLLAAVRSINPNVGVEFADELFGEGPGVTASGTATAARQPVAGYADKAQGMIAIALRDTRFDPLDTAYHEAWHSIEDLLTDQEVAVLREAFPGGKHRAVPGRVTPVEHAAIEFAAYATGERRAAPKPAVRRIFSKIADMLRRLANMLRNRGFNSVDSIFRAASEGKIGRRQPAAQAPAGAMEPAYSATRRTLENDSRGLMERNADRFLDFVHGKFGYRLHTLGALPEMRKYLEMRYRALGDVDRIERAAREIYRMWSNASAADKQRAFEYLENRGADPSQIQDEDTRRLAVQTKQMIDRIGQKTVQAGLLDQETWERNRGTYVPRVYLKHILAGDFNWGTGMKVSDLGYIKKRKDIPLEVRLLALGQVTDPALLSSLAYERPSRDMVIFDLLKQIAGNNEWVYEKSMMTWQGHPVTIQWMEAESQRIAQMATHQPNEALRRGSEQLAMSMARAVAQKKAELGQENKDLSDFRQVPNTARYGKLRGMWVRKEIWDDLIDAMSAIPRSENIYDMMMGPGGMAEKANGLWKMSKVSLNPPTQVRNFISNQVLLYMSGVPARRLLTGELMIRAVNELIREKQGKPTRHMQVARDYGIGATTFAAQELYEIRDALLDLQAQNAEGLSGMFTMLKVQAQRVAKIAGDAYQMSETLGKLMKIIDAMDREGMSAADAALEAQHWLFDYSLVTPSVRRLRRAPIGIPFLCVDEETEVLTNSGWQTIDTVSEGDLAASFDMETETLKWQPILDVYRSDYDGPMVHVEDRHLDMLMTPDHRCVTYRRRRTPGQRDVNGKHLSLEIQQARDLKCADHIPVAAPFEHEPINPLQISDDMASLLGWIIAEGTFLPKGSAIGISQKEGDKAEEIRRLLDSVAGTDGWTERTAGHKYRGTIRPLQHFYIRVGPGSEIRPHIPGKQLTPELLMRLPLHQIRLLVDAMIAADGHVNKKDGRRCFTQNPGATLEAFCMALTMLGESYSIREKPDCRCMLVLIRDGKRYCIKRGRKGEVHYKGRIWCPRVANTATWVARRNGKIFITHNTFYVKVMPRIIEAFMKRPVRMIALSMLPYIAAEGIAHMYDVDDDDVDKLREALPEYQRANRHAYLWPYKDENGRWQIIDLGYFMPWQMYEEVGVQLSKGEFSEAMQTGGLLSAPLIDIMTAIQTGKDPFTKREIMNEHDPPEKKIQDLVAYGWRLAAPTWTTDIGFAGHMYRALTDYVDPYTREPKLTETQAALRFVGLNVYPIRPEETRARNLRFMKYELSEVKARMRKLMRDPNLSDGERDRLREHFRNRLRQLGEEMREYAVESEIHPNLRTERPRSPLGQAIQQGPAAAGQAVQGLSPQELGRQLDDEGLTRLRRVLEGLRNKPNARERLQEAVQ